MKYLIIILLFINLSASAIKVDSLVDVSKKNTEYHLKYNVYTSLISYYLRKDLDSAKYFINQFLRLGEVHNDSKFLSNAYEFRAEIYEKEAKYDDAIKYYQKAHQIYLVEEDSFQTSEILKFIGRVYSDKGDSKNALKYYLESDDLKELLGDQKGKASIYNSIGALYYDAENFKEALAYYEKSLRIVEELDFAYAVGVINMNIANIYKDVFYNDTTDLKKDFLLDSLGQAYFLAIKHYKISLEIFEQAQVIEELSSVYSNLGAIDTTNAIQYFQKSYEIRLEMGDIMGQWRDLKNIAKRYKDMKDYKSSKKYSKKALQIAEENKLFLEIASSLFQLSGINAELKEFESAYKDLDAFYELDDSLKKANKNNEFSKLARKWNYEKEESKNKILQKDKELGEERIAKQRLYLWASGLGLALFGFLIFFILRGYRQKQKANQLLSAQKELIEDANKELNQQNEEIVAQRDEIGKQRDLVLEQKEQIEEIHHEVSQSIDYAERLQAAILPKQDLLKENLNDYFVLFMPKDKVSGDYYWWTKVNEQLVITAADCTGHGVPGAFMSMLGVSFLKEIVNKEFITQPALILKKMRAEIIRTLDQKGISGEQKDGMDMALLSVHKSGHVQFSGANNPLYVVSKNDILEQVPDAKTMNEGGIETLYDIKPDKMPIAIYEKMDDFTNLDLHLKKGDMLYMFSDGYADQFGGPKGKKFKYKPFKRLILENSQKPMLEQMTILKQAFEDWRGEEEQIDDVVVIGLKI